MAPLLTAYLSALLQTDEAVPIDTEAQMKEAAAALKEEEEGGSKAETSGQNEVMVRQP